MGWGGLLYCFVFYLCFLTFSGKSGKKLHLNWCLLACLQHSGNKEAFGWRLKETQAWLPFLLPHRAGQSWPAFCADSLKKGPEAAKGSGFLSSRNFTLGLSWSWSLGPSVSGTQGRPRLRRGRVNSEEGAGETAERGPVERILKNESDVRYSVQEACL